MARPKKPAAALHTAADTQALTTKIIECLDEGELFLALTKEGSSWTAQACVRSGGTVLYARQKQESVFAQVTAPTIIAMATKELATEHLCWILDDKDSRLGRAATHMRFALEVLPDRTQALDLGHRATQLAIEGLLCGLTTPVWELLRDATTKGGVDTRQIQSAIQVLITLITELQKEASPAPTPIP